jgi:hypothetical protein
MLKLPIIIRAAKGKLLDFQLERLARQLEHHDSVRAHVLKDHVIRVEIKKLDEKYVVVVNGEETPYESIAECCDAVRALVE